MSTPLSLPTKGTIGRRLVLRGLGPVGTSPTAVPAKSLTVRGMRDHRTILRGMGPVGSGQPASSVVNRGFGSRRILTKGFYSAASHGNFPFVLLISTDVLGL